MCQIEFCANDSVSENQETLSVNVHENNTEKGIDLGFNGPIVSIKSNFLPPQPDYTSHWLGAVKVYALQKEVGMKYFKCEDEHQLKMQVAAYVESILDKVGAASVPC